MRTGSNSGASSERESTGSAEAFRLPRAGFSSSSNSVSGRMRFPGQRGTEVSVFVQLFEGWRYRPGARERLFSRRHDGPSTVMNPDVPGLLARVLAIGPNDRDTGIGVWVWESEEACRVFERNRPPEVEERIASEIDQSGMIERAFDPLYFGHRC